MNAIHRIFMGFFVFTATTTCCAQSFTVVDSLTEGAYGAAAWGDFDNDGFMDLAYNVQAGPGPADICIVMHNNGTSFTQVSQHITHLFNPSIKWADLNNDGFDDLVMNGADSVFIPRTIIYQSNGNGTFTEIPNPIMGLSAGSVAISDYNNDGLKDIAVTGFDFLGSHHAAIYKCTGTFTYTDIQATLWGTHFGEMQWGDYDNDSLPDLVINGIGDFDFKTRVYKNMGVDSFLVQPFNMEGTGGTVDWADFDNDGWLDILVTGYDSSSVNNITELHHNNGNGTFSIASTNLPVFGEPSGVAIADFNNDSIRDICFIGSGNIFPFNASALVLGTGTNTFNIQQFMNGSIMDPVVEASDIDSDGDIDLLFHRFILRNDGPVGLPDLIAGEDILAVYPNPSRDPVHIRATAEMESVDLFDLAGKHLLNVIVTSKDAEIEASNFESGIYFLRIQMKNGNTVFKRICFLNK